MGDNAFGLLTIYPIIPNPFTPSGFIFSDYMFLEYEGNGKAEFLQLYALLVGTFYLQVSPDFYGPIFDHD